MQRLLKNIKLLLEASRNKACEQNVENVEEYQVYIMIVYIIQCQESTCLIIYGRNFENSGHSIQKRVPRVHGKRVPRVQGLGEVGCVVHRNQCRESTGRAEPTFLFHTRKIIDCRIIPELYSILLEKPFTSTNKVHMAILFLFQFFHSYTMYAKI